MPKSPNPNKPRTLLKTAPPWPKTLLLVGPYPVGMVYWPYSVEVSPVSQPLIPGKGFLTLLREVGGQSQILPVEESPF